ncbi:hypothetical protein RDI58_027026 [Solanum bulbocastanum]|uniref:Uncharacterized protein n=1 Tax=Solanum bulbocastanum TaxID=147425 RepID=A0AAN8SWZ9_SOLBU
MVPPFASLFMSLLIIGLKCTIPQHTYVRDNKNGDTMRTAIGKVQGVDVSKDYMAQDNVSNRTTKASLDKIRQTR